MSAKPRKYFFLGNKSLDMSFVTDKCFLRIRGGRFFKFLAEAVKSVFVKEFIMIIYWFSNSLHIFPKLCCGARLEM